MIDGKDNSDIYAANLLEKRVQILLEEIDLILTPILDKCINNGEYDNKEDIEALLLKLPSGFHRAELRTHYNKTYKGA